MNSSFSIREPDLQLAWDATSLDALKQCPRKYQLSIIFGKISGKENIHLTFGIFYHSSLETFQRALAEGLDFRHAQIKMVRFALEQTWTNGRPWFSGDNYKNRFTLLRSLIWHTDQYKDDNLETIIVAGRPAIELSFHYQIPYKASTNENYILCGHLDRMVNFNGLIFAQDYKTTKFSLDSDFFQFYSPDNQMSMYSLAGRVIYKKDLQGVIVDAAQIQVNNTQFRRGPILRTESQVNEWYRELTRHWLPMANTFALENYWPMNDTACGRYGGCQFRAICSKSPEVREEWLQSLFKTREWDPIKVRGDI